MTCIHCKKPIWPGKPYYVLSTGRIHKRCERKGTPAVAVQRVVRAKPTLKDLVASAHAAGVKVTCHLEPILRVEVSQGMEADLNTLVRSGLFGVNASEAARRILEEWLWNNTMRIAALRPNIPS